MDPLSIVSLIILSVGSVGGGLYSLHKFRLITPCCQLSMDDHESNSTTVNIGNNDGNDNEDVVTIIKNIQNMCVRMDANLKVCMDMGTNIESNTGDLKLGVRLNLNKVQDQFNSITKEMEKTKDIFKSVLDSQVQTENNRMLDNIANDIVTPRTKHFVMSTLKDRDVCVS